MMNYSKDSLVKTLRKFMIDVYANLTSRKEIEDYIQKTLGLKVLSGQKRLIVMTGGAEVLKIAYDRDGLMDNMNEIICSNRLRELRQQGLISDDDLGLFGLCEPLYGSPFIIQMEAGTNFDEDPDFIEWYRRILGVNSRPNYESDALWFPVYMAENLSLKDDFARQQNILAQFFVASDITPTKEPRNETLKTRRGTNGQMVKRLFLIDMGSCFPVLKDAAGRDVRPVCPRCGSSLINVAYSLPGDINQSNAQDITGKCGCLNPNCELYYKNLPTGMPIPQLEDSAVFTLYQSTHAASVRYMRAVECGYYMPTYKVMNKQELASAFMNEYGLQNMDATLLENMWTNYIAKACGNILGCNPELLDLQLQDQYGRLSDYPQYRTQAALLLQQLGETLDTIAMRTIGLQYLHAIVNITKNAPEVLFNMLTMDQNSFIANAVQMGLPQQSAYQLYVDVMGNF